MLTIYIDFKSAASYLALEPTLALIQETGIEARWLPFSSRALIIPAEKPHETVGERHRRVRAISQRNTHLHYAKVQEINMEFADDPAGSDAALQALTALKESPSPIPFVRSAFEAYWVNQADLNDRSAAARLLTANGYDDPDWEVAESQLDAIRNDALDRKVFETPTYLIDGQIFLGREHLPWIRTVADDRMRR